MSKVALSKTYKESAQEFIDKSISEGKKPTEESIYEIMEYAKYLDSFSILSDKLQILAYQKAREIDGEVLFALQREIPKERVTEIVKDVYDKHYKRNKKNDGK